MKRHGTPEKTHLKHCVASSLMDWVDIFEHVLSCTLISHVLCKLPRVPEHKVLLVELRKSPHASRFSLRMRNCTQFFKSTEICQEKRSEGYSVIFCKIFNRKPPLCLVTIRWGNSSAVFKRAIKIKTESLYFHPVDDDESYATQGKFSLIYYTT